MGRTGSGPGYPGAVRTWIDISLALAVLGLCAWAVVWQFSDNAAVEESAKPIEPLQLGETLEIDFTLRDMDEIPKPRNLMASYGRAATVLYTWSVPCPCIDDMEPRMRALHERYNREKNAVTWVALAGEPEDTRGEIREKMDRLDVFYPVLRDPEQRVCRRLGLVHAGQVAVLDAAGRLAYRGSVDDDYEDGQGEHLEEALAALVAGRPVPMGERERAYGCGFSIPLSCRSLPDPKDATRR